MKKLTSAEQNRKRNLTSFVVAIAFLFNSICLLANIIFPSIDNFGELFVIFTLLLGIVSMFLRLSFKIRLNILLPNVFILIFMLISYFYYKPSSTVLDLMLNYVVWGLGIVFIMTQGFDEKKVIEYSFWISTAVIIAELMVSANQRYELMTWSYAVFPSVAVTIVHFWYCRFQKYRYFIFYIPSLIMLIKFILNVNRGGLLSLVSLMLFIVIKSTKQKGGRLKTRRAITFVLSVGVLLFALFFEQIIVELYEYLSSIGYEITAIRKTYKLIITDNVTNNRNELYSYAWKGFLESPIFGHGIGAFSINHGGWVHNLVLQLLYEGGILLSAVVLIPLVKNCIFVIRSTRITKYEYAMFILLFSTSIPKLLVSTELWNTQTFWMLCAFGVFISSVYSKSRRTL